MRTKLFDCSSLSFFAGRTRIASCVAGALLVLSSAAAHGQTINVARGSHAAKQTTADTRGRITSAILAEVMLAEIAAQRGDLGPAFRAFMAVAEQTSDARLARRAAEVAVMARDDESALTAVRLWVRLAPLDKEADAALGALLVETGRFAEVEPKLAARLKESPAPGAAIEDLQRSYARARDRNAAFASLARLAAPYTDDASTHLALARMAFLAGLNDRAISEAREAARRDPTSEIAALTVAQLLAANAPDEAVRALETHVKNNPNAINVRIALARVYGSKGRIDDARRELLAVIERRPENLDALLALGVLEYQARNLSVAETRLKAYLAQAERVGDEARDMQTAYITLSQIVEDRRQFDEAIDWMTRLQPPSIAAQTRIAQLHAKAGRVDQGLDVLRAIQPGDNVERQQLASAEALVLREARRYQDAFDRLAKELTTQPESAELLYDYALAAEKLDKVDVMEKALRRVITLRPDDPHAYNALGYSLADRRLRLDEARQLVEKAVQLAPDDPFIADSLGWVEYRSGNFKRAIEILERAYAIRPDAEIAAHLGEVLWAAGERARAEALWRSAKERDPSNETLVETLARHQQR